MRPVICPFFVHELRLRFPVEPSVVERSIADSDEAIFVRPAPGEQFLSARSSVESRRRVECSGVSARDLAVGQPWVEVVSDSSTEPLYVNVD